RQVLQPACRVQSFELTLGSTGDAFELAHPLIMEQRGGAFVSKGADHPLSIIPDCAVKHVRAPIITRLLAQCRHQTFALKMFTGLCHQSFTFGKLGTSKHLSFVIARFAPFARSPSALCLRRPTIFLSLQRSVVDPAQRHSEFVADLAAKCARLPRPA